MDILEPVPTRQANPQMVETLIHAMGVALNKTVVPHVTSTADMLSAVMTVLERMLRAARDLQSAEDQAHNAKEVGNALSALLLEYGASPTTIN